MSHNQNYEYNDGDEFLNRFNNLAESIGKLIISLSTGIIVISMAFIKDIIPNEKVISVKWLLLSGWGSEIISLIFGILYLYSFLKFYDSPYKSKTISKKSEIALLPFFLGTVQFSLFILGLSLISIFAFLNI